MLLYEIMGDAWPPNGCVVIMLNIYGMLLLEERLGEMNGMGIYLLLIELVLEFF